MALDAESYFNYIRSSFNLKFYAVPIPNPGELKLVEKIDVGKSKPLSLVTRFTFEGEVLAIKLDKEVKKGQHEPLFHFLDNQGRPWSKRCDFVVFHLYKKQLKIYCFEFKYQSVDSESVINQLKASECWCKALNSLIGIYTGHKKKIKLAKYLVTDCTEDKASRYLDDQNSYLARDPSIKHYFYHELDGMDLHKLEYKMVEPIG